MHHRKRCTFKSIIGRMFFIELFRLLDYNETIAVFYVDSCSIYIESLLLT